MTPIFELYKKVDEYKTYALIGLAATALAVGTYIAIKNSPYGCVRDKMPTRAWTSLEYTDSLETRLS